MKRILIFILAVFLAVPAMAALKYDTFWCNWDSGIFVEGGGSGWDAAGDGQGDWVSYPSGWWNQWFYDDPPDPQRWKIIDYRITIQLDPAAFANFDIAINWSSLNFPESGPDGEPPMLDEFVIRESVFSGPVNEFMEIAGQIIVPDYNPEWVSIDIMPLDADGVVIRNGGGSMVYIEGEIWHECVPEPTTILLLSLGCLMLRKHNS